MTDRPIIFSAPMVRALLEGRKTQTRRIIKPRRRRPSLFDGTWSDSYVLDPANASWRAQDVRYEPGDRLWVRESHYVWSAGNQDGSGQRIDYMATEPDSPCGGWTPSIHMPRWASRLTLIITSVKVERLQDISEQDAIAEGIERAGDIAGQLGWKHYPDGSPAGGWLDPRESFRSLWNSINGTGAWDTDPWVVALSFTVHKGNIDSLEGQP